jgi:hypothetical protein
MTSRAFQAAVLVGAISVYAVAAAEQPPQPKPEDATQANPVPEEKAKQREQAKQQLLADLKNRCQKMLATQTAIQKGTVDLDKVLKAGPDNQPRTRKHQVSLKLSHKQQDLIAEATAVIDMLNAEGSAVALSEVFEVLREDMSRVRGRLENADVGSTTQAVEKDIIDILQDLVTGLTPRKH